MSNGGLPTYEAVMQNVRSYTFEFGQTAQAEKLLLRAPFQSTLDINVRESQDPLDFSFFSKEENEKLTLEIAKLLSSDQGKAIIRDVPHKINKDIKSIRDMFFTIWRRLKDLDDKGQSSAKFG
ncbi:hypothetical protein N7533_007517 [Penicillium manginii]|uniref:uncharacterized protein n=1 Tax=Penicillium manginii TaxID=203109 RepID=UPI0025494FA1|nr:uncharacterized protein N7533_007517 [Penicillium manginii]KAJ5750489.1 hypothetical protein N7533_007517 [Penicillium manginii]